MFSRFKHKFQKVLNINLKHIHNVTPELNFDFISNSSVVNKITENIARRKGVGNIQNVINLYNKLKQIDESNADYNNIKNALISEALKIPNDTHEDILNYGTTPKTINVIGSKKEFQFKPMEFSDLTKNLNIMRTSQLGNVSGSRSYYFYGALAELEQSLIRYTITKLLKQGFQLLSVPDLLPKNIIESCGMTTSSDRTQIYKLNHSSNLYLSGTSEMAIAGFFQNKVIDENKLPIKIAAISRCYRAETSSVFEERGIFRVHQFTKVEMFSLTKPNDSDAILESFREFQEKHFSSLGICLQTLDMPPHELGASAYRKYDIEAWFPGRNAFGEISSCSNCTDYQAQRLNIKYKASNGDLIHVHTVNGTALAVPRILIALLETYQNDKGIIELPEVLKPLLTFDKIHKEKRVPELKLKKIKY